MVHLQRLISSTMIVTSCAVTLLLLNINKSFCLGQENISHNLIRDPVELGNSYQQPGGNGHGTVMTRIKNPHHRKPSQHQHFSQSPSQIELASAASTSGSGHHHHSNKAANLNNREASTGRQPVTTAKKLNSSDEKSEEAACPLCTAAKKNAGLDDETLRAARIELVKKQILKKLRLTEPPKMENIPRNPHTALPPIALGNPVLSNAVRNDQEDDVANMDMEDFFGKTEQIIVLPQDEISDCAMWSNNNPNNRAASCFIFNLPKEVRSNQISSAELWVYKLSDVDEQGYYPKNNNFTHHFSISEMINMPNHPRSTSRHSTIHASPIVDRFDVSQSSSWVNFNITERARKWLVTEGPDHTIKISCSTCSQDVNEFPFNTSGDQQPFIVFNIANGKRRRRNRRSVNCNAGMTACCRESLQISFEEIHWDWVLEPKSFDAYYCKGNCQGDAAIGSAATRHTGVIIDYVKHQGGVNNKTQELVPCCTATEMSSISLIYRDPQSYNTTFTHVKLPNMVVQSCGCK